MDNPFEKLLNPIQQQLHPYVPGKSIQEIKKHYHINDVIKMASNENPWGCSPYVTHFLKKLHVQDISNYPNTYLHPFFNALSQHLQLPSPMIFISNGSDAIFSLLIQAFALPQQKHTLTHEYAFMGFEIQTRSFGLETIKVPVDPKTWRVSKEDLIKQVTQKTAIIFLANPNNPTGQMLPYKDIISILDNIPKNCIFVLDQAYYEYTHPDAINNNIEQLIEKYPNLVITRTFSKAYGLAGLRLGYAMGHPDLIDILKRIQLPFTINQMALSAGFEAINDQKFISEIVKLTAQGHQFLHEKLSKFPFMIRQSFGNFVTIEQQTDISPLVTYLESQGIIIRGLHHFGLPNAARISVGTPRQNLRCVETISKFLHN